VFPDRKWIATPLGNVVTAEKDELFDLSQNIDRALVLTKLRQHGWEIKETTRDRKPYYKAVKHLHEPGKPKTEDDQGHPDIEILIGRVVEEVLGK
jgi:hypothetical protein